MKFKKIYSTYNPQDIAFIKSVFEENSIIYRTENEWSNGAFFAGGIHVMVCEDQHEEAKDLIKDFQDKQGHRPI